MRWAKDRKIGVVVFFLIFAGVVSSASAWVVKDKVTIFNSLASEYDAARQKSGDFSLKEAERDKYSVWAYVAEKEMYRVYRRLSEEEKKKLFRNWKFKTFGETKVDRSNIRQWLEKNFFAPQEIDALSMIDDLPGKEKRYRTYLAKRGLILP
jgi:hypothetical protein